MKMKMKKMLLLLMLKYEPNSITKDITGLPNFQGYARVQLSNETLLPFSFRTLKDDDSYNSGKAKIILKRSSVRYGVDCKDIDKQIYDRLHSYEKMVEQTV